MSSIYKRKENLTTWLLDLDLSYEIRGTGSVYVTVETGHDEDWPYTRVRISDHAQPIDEMGNPVGGFGHGRCEGLGGRYDAADISVHPGGATIAQAKRLIRERIGEARYQTARRAHRAREAEAVAWRAEADARELASIIHQLATAPEEELGRLYHSKFPSAGTVRDSLLRRRAELEAA